MAEKVDDEQLKAIVASQIRGALGFDSDQLSAKRADNIERYEGEPYGDERPGRSQVMSRDVMETVEAVMPSLVRAFLGNEEVVKFEPESQEDEAYAAQATDYVNLVLMRDNPGFRIAMDWMKSSLIESTSVVKLWWDESDKVQTQVYSELSDQEFVQLVQDDNVEVLEHTAFARVNGQLVEPDDAMAMQALGGVPVEAAHEVKIKRTQTKARLRWEAVPSEEFLINRRARSLDEDDSTFAFCCHRQTRTIEELLQEGYDEEIVMSAGSGEPDDEYLDEEIERTDDLEYTDAYHSDQTKLQRRVWVYECYLKADYDGDGISELRRVTVLGGGTNTQILDNEEAEELPFADLTAIRLPFRFYGWSLADLTKDIQRLKTALWRAMMDGLYLSLYPHKAVDENRVDLDDLLSEEPGSTYRVNGDPGSAIVPMATQWNGAQAFPMMEYIDRVLISRSGVNDLAGGLDGGVLQGETARAVDEAANAARARVELMARVFAETGWTRLMKLALKMLNRHQDRARTVRLRNEWVPIDPRSWNVDMDVRINVALGIGTKGEQINKLMALLGKQEAIMAQMGPTNPMAPLGNYYKGVSKLSEAMDVDPDALFTDPAEWVEQQRQQPPPPNPEMEKAKAEMAMEQQKAQASLQQSQAEAQLRAETDRMKAENDAAIARERAQMDAQAAIQKAQLQAQVDREVAANKLELERDKMQQDHAYRMAELAAEQELEREKMRAGSRDGQGNINLSD